MRRYISLGLTAVVFLIAHACFADPDIEVRIDGPTCSPDGYRVAFAVVSDHPRFCILDLTMGKVETIRFPGRLVEAFYGISWDSKGRFLVATIIEGVAGKPGPFSIWQLDLGTLEWSRVSEPDTDIYQRPLVSPDRKTVLFRAATGRDLVVADLNSGRQRSVTKCGDIYRLGYDWTPDGERIYFSRGYMSRDNGLWSVNADGTDMKVVSKEFEPYALAVSKTGRYIAFAETNGRNSLFVSGLDAFDPIEISANCSLYFSWSPNDDRLAFCTAGCIKVWKPSTDNTGKGSVVTIANGNCSYPIWTREGKAVLFNRSETSLWEHHLSTGETKEVYALSP